MSSKELTRRGFGERTGATCTVMRCHQRSVYVKVACIIVDEGKMHQSGDPTIISGALQPQRIEEACIEANRNFRVCRSRCAVRTDQWSLAEDPPTIRRKNRRIQSGQKLQSPLQSGSN